MVMIGDGATDLEARSQGAVDLFIGSTPFLSFELLIGNGFRYGGVVERPVIVDQADWFVRDIGVLLDALD